MPKISLRQSPNVGVVAPPDADAGESQIWRPSLLQTDEGIGLGRWVHVHQYEMMHQVLFYHCSSGLQANAGPKVPAKRGYVEENLT